jgi:hypothetical protein
MTEVPSQRHLGEFEYGGLPDKPVVIIDANSTAVRVPTDKTKLAGRIGIDKKRGGKAYVSHKKRQKHYYRKKGGYAISIQILNRLMNEAHTLYWVEHTRGDTHPTTYEFGIKQYVEESDKVEHASVGDPQVIVSNEDARHIWPDHDAEADLRA